MHFGCLRKPIMTLALLIHLTQSQTLKIVNDVEEI